MSQLTFDADSARALEAIYMTPDVVAQRGRVIDLLAPAAGEHLLDVGVGPGLLALDLARLVGESGRMVGLDLAPAMVAAATARLAGLSQAEVRVGDAANLDLPDGAFDGAVSTQVYEYVADMPRALAELHRVLRPGGRALILDTDWRSLVWHSSDPARMDRVLACWDAHLADPHLPAKLGPLLREAGFSVRRTEIVPMFSPRWQPVSYAGGMVRTIRNFVRANGARFGLDDAELQAWWAEQEALIAADAFFFSVNRYAFLATR
ncbi:MAG: methyltransferase domain-containing protein [Phenylobacterium sp.]|uniref:methyltransferase domain-containing protein n=1 Tax=Phenylobacterium sp. TaxID=1871053 RepID=UPI002726C257|nr:methyltransferase domain-containing protein [Phenylobacterium sp.]MDO8910462.1 methyltransferase domain-containing protein [Phenylobacterium sp.]MDP3101291.1 methyltransferase domain-containing protein [Phenylobacterium sp.]